MSVISLNGHLSLNSLRIKLCKAYNIMSVDDAQLKKLQEQLKKSSADIFKKKPADVQCELEKNKVFGSSKNLAESTYKKDD